MGKSASGSLADGRADESRTCESRVAAQTDRMAGSAGGASSVPSRAPGWQSRISRDAEPRARLPSRWPAPLRGRARPRPGRESRRRRVFGHRRVRALPGPVQPLVFSRSSLKHGSRTCAQVSARLDRAHDHRVLGARDVAADQQLLVELLARSQTRCTGSRCRRRVVLRRAPSGPVSRIMRRASSSICTGSPMSSTKTSPPVPIEPACSTSCAASGIVMK